MNCWSSSVQRPDLRATHSAELMEDGAELGDRTNDMRASAIPGGGRGDRTLLLRMVVNSCDSEYEPALYDIRPNAETDETF